MQSPSDVPNGGSSGTLPIDVVLRAVAIACVVFNHVYYHERGFDFGGGLNALFVLNGYSIARFALSTDTPALASRSLLKVILNVVGPTLLMILLVATYYSEFDPAALLFYSNLLGDNDFRFVFTWYIQAFMQILLVVALILMIPGVGTRALRNPYAASLIGFGLSLVVLAVAQMLSATPDKLDFRPQYHAWNLMLGIVIYFLLSSDLRFRAAQKIAMVAASLAIAVWYWGDTTQILRPYFLMAAILGLLYLTSVPLPAIPRQFLLLVAQSTFFIFLLHGAFIKLAEKAFPKAPDAYPFWNVVGCWTIGLFGPIVMWIAWTATVRCVVQRVKNQPTPLPSVGT